MVTYKVVNVAAWQGKVMWAVVAKESGVVVAGPFAHKGQALAEANLRASSMPGNRVES